MSSTDATVSAPPPNFVPVEYRIFGFDRRTIPAALSVLALAVLFAFVLPAINDAVKYDEPIVAGDVLDLGDGVLTLTPTVGWDLAAGARVGEGRTKTAVPFTTTILKDDVKLSVTTGPYTGTARSLARQIDVTNDRLDDARGLGPASAVTTTRTQSGIPGVARGYASTDTKGLVAAFVVKADPPISGRDSVGIEVVVTGSAASILANAQDISDMVESIAYTPGGTS